MKFVRLTRPDGTAIRFGEGLVIRPPPPTAPVGSHTEITYSGGTYFVHETPDEVVAAFEDQE